MDKSQWQKAIKRREGMTEEEIKERKRAEEARKWKVMEEAKEKRERKRKNKPNLSPIVKEKALNALFLAQTEKERSMGRGLRRDPAGRYVALAYNSIQVQHWCRVHDINPLNVRAIDTPQDVRGVGFDLIVVCFSDFGERNDTRFRDACTLVQGRAIAWRYPEKEHPVVVRGRIIGWASVGEEADKRGKSP